MRSRGPKRTFAWMFLVALAGCGDGSPGATPADGEGQAGASADGPAGRSVVQLEEEQGSPVRADRPLLGTCRLSLERSLGGRDDFGRITMLRRLGERLVVTDYLLPPHLKVVDLATGEVIGAIGRAGEGPGEFRVATSLFVRSRDPPEVAVYDYQNQRVTFIRFEDETFRPVVAGERELLNGLGLIGLQPYRRGYVSTGLFPDYTLVRLDSAGRPAARLVADPPFGPEDIGGSLQFAAQMNNATMAAGERGDVAVAYEEEAIVDLIDLDAGSYRRVRGPEPVETEYEIRDGRLHTGEGNERAYSLVTASDELVLAGFLGDDFQTDRYGQKPVRIHVFDWRGRYLAELELDRAVTALRVSPDGSTLWGAYADPVPRIGEWSLPPLVGPDAPGDLGASPLCDP